MKISRDWLSDFITWTEKDPEVIADRMTRSMGEVDEIVEQGKLLKHCVVGKVLTIEKHPNADKLSVCGVETDKGVKRVVCGGTNLKRDMLVAFAHVGATVKAGKELVTLERVKIRGEESEGMICAAEEVELEALFPPKLSEGNRPIADLTKGNYRVGAPLREVLKLNDAVFHIDNHAITNRPDLFSHIGVARELVAMGLGVWKKEPKVPHATFPKTAPPFKLENNAGALLPYYEGVLLSVKDLPDTPDWMKRRLLGAGWRPFNLIVDITNYVLLEVGMPLHAFDADDFRGDLHIRQVTNGEKITTLDGVERVLPEGAVVISDDEGIFDLFGTMGGRRTSQKPTTTHIFLQAGIIDPVSVRRTAIATGHRTEAATVYEKGVAPVTAHRGLRRAIELLTTLAPETVVASKLVTWGKDTPKKGVQISMKRLQEFLGATIGIPEIKRILKDLGCTIKGGTDAITVTPPEWRSDLRMEQDLIEEVGRIFGYSKIPSTAPEAPVRIPPRDSRIHKLRDTLKEDGYTELLNLAFTNTEILKRASLDPGNVERIENPMGEELSLMRTSLLPGILETIGREQRKGEAGYTKVYEYGNIFEVGSERPSLALVVAAPGKTTIESDPLLVLKADLARATQEAGHTVTFTQKKEPLPPYAHTGRSAEIRSDGKCIGLLTEIHPDVRKAFGIVGRAATALIELDALWALKPRIRLMKPLPLFPVVAFDETVPLPKIPFGELEKKILTIDPLIQSLEIVHLYEKDDTRNLTLRFTYQADDRTLKQEEAEKVHEKVLVELKKV